jgi:hypothetical protein
MPHKAKSSIQSHGDGSSPNGDVSGRHSDEIDEHGYGKDRASAADQAQHHANEAARGNCEHGHNRPNGHEDFLKFEN